MVNYKEKPLQSISLTEKLKVDKNEKFINSNNVKSQVSLWIKQNVDYWINRADFNKQSEMISIINAINGELDADLYKYVLNPYKGEESKRQLPAKLRNYDIINPIKNVLLGERNQQPNMFTVINTSSNVVSAFKEYQNNLLYKNYQNNVITNLQKYGLIDIENEKTFEPYQKILENSKLTFDDIRAKVGQETLEYLVYNLKVDDIIQSLYEDYFDVGFYCTYKFVFKNDIYYERVAPYDIWYEGDNDITYIEDSEACVRKLYWSLSTIIDRFKLDEETYKRFEEKSKQGLKYTRPIVHLKAGENIKNYSQGITGYHVVWKSIKKIGILTFVNEFGIIEETEVDESYKLNKEIGDISLVWEFQNEWWECYRFYDNEYLKFGIGLEQRNDINNNSISKLPYNGKKFNKNSNEVYSLGKIGLTYQVLYNIFHFQFEKIMNKNKESLMLMPLGLKPASWTMEKWLYFTDATGYAWFDEKNTNLQAVLNSIKGINLSLGNFAEQMQGFMMALKNEWWDFIGMSRQRIGDIKTSDGKGTAEQAIYRSAIVTDEFSRKFLTFLETEYQGLLDLSKIAFIDGKKAQYIVGDLFKTVVDIDGGVLSSSSFGVFVKNSVKESQKLNKAEQLLLTIGQNGGRGSDLVESLELNSVAQIKETLRKGEELIDKMNQQKSEAENAAQIEIQKLENERFEKELELKKYIADTNYKAVIDKATLDAEAKIQTANYLEPDNLIDINSASDNFHKKALELREQNRKDQELKNKTKLKEKEINSKLEIAKINKNKYDKK